MVSAAYGSGQEEVGAGTKGIQRKGTCPKMGFNKGRTSKDEPELYFERNLGSQEKKGGKCVLSRGNISVKTCKVEARSGPQIDCQDLLAEDFGFRAH